MFRRDRPSAPDAAGGRVPDGPAPARLTRIAPGTRVSGAIGGATELLVEGEVEGEIRVEAPVVVGPGGVVRGPIAAPVVRVAGQVLGDVRAGDRVEVGPGGTLEGDITAPRVVIAEGAFFKGNVEMQGDKARGDRPSGGPAAPPGDD
jgi:cytoskeletal protein CcmA (bactofilin family)